MTNRTAPADLPPPFNEHPLYGWKEPLPANIAEYFRWMHDEAPTLSLAGHKRILLEMETYFRNDERRKALEEALQIVRDSHDRTVAGVRIRALIDRKEPTT